MKRMATKNKEVLNVPTFNWFNNILDWPRVEFFVLSGIKGVLNMDFLLIRLDNTVRTSDVNFHLLVCGIFA